MAPRAHVTAVLSVKIMVGTLRKVLVNHSRCTMSSRVFFENCVARALLWCFFQAVAKIAYNLSIFSLHQQNDMLMGSSSLLYYLSMYIEFMT